MARILKGSHFYLHTPRSSANGMNHTCFHYVFKNKKVVYNISASPCMLQLFY